MFRQESLEQVSARAGPQHSGEELAESTKAQAERIVAEELRKRRWRGEDLATMRKEDPEKVALAPRLRRGRTTTLEWIAARLGMGTETSLAHPLYWTGRNGGEQQHDTID